VRAGVVAVLFALAGPLGLTVGTERALAAKPDPAAKILLLVEVGQEPLEARLRAELESLGFTIERRPAPPMAPGARPTLEADAKAAEAAAAVRVRASENGVEVWIADRMTGKTLLREVVRGSDDEAVVAVRVVELLRASLLEVDSSLPPRGDVPIPKPAKQAAKAARPPQRDFFSVFGAGTISLSPAWEGRALSPLAHLRFGATLRPIERVGIDLDVTTPIAPASLEGPEGFAQATMFLTTVGLHGSVLPEQGRFRLRFGGGIGLFWSHVWAQAAPGNFAKDGDWFAAYLYGRAGFAVALAPPVRIRLDLEVGVVAPGLKILFAGRRAGEWGQPVGFPVLGLEGTFGR